MTTDDTPIFYSAKANNTVAVVDRSTYEAIQIWNRLERQGEEPGRYPDPIFMFAPQHRIDSNRERWLTGSLEDLAVLTANCTVEKAELIVPIPHLLGAESQEILGVSGEPDGVRSLIGSISDLLEVFPPENIMRLAALKQGLVERPS